MNIGPQMADISVDNQMAYFNTGPYKKGHFFTLDHMGTPLPLKNQNFENWASTCFKLAQIRPRAKIS